METKTKNSANVTERPIPIEEVLFREWQETKNTIEARVVENLEYSYKLEQFKNSLVQALAFWNFFVQRIAYCCFVEDRRKFLALIDPGGNMLLRIVVQIEMLPALVFRRILWKDNIDFMSLESFLRRLTGEQMAAIEQNFTDLFQEKIVPRVFGKIEKFFRRMTVEKLLEMPEDARERYDRKASWSYNLLDLDFGFNAYPGGIIDDTKIIEVSPLRFLSKKNHADDFAVNQENGKYWWLYKNARSNYIYEPDRDVRLNTHICPGFWWTFFVHLFFWVISPVLFVIFCAISHSSEFPRSLFGLLCMASLGIPALFTPSWILAAIIKLAYVELVSEKIRKTLEKTLAFIGKCLGCTILVALCLVCIAVIAAGIYGLYCLLYPAFGTAASIGIILGIIYYVIIERAHDGNVPWTQFVKCPQYWFPAMVFTLGVTAKFVIVYGEWMAQWCKRIAEAIWGMLMMLGPAAVLFAIPPVVMLVAYRANKKWDKDRQEKFFDLVEKLLSRFAIPLVVPYAIVVSIRTHSTEMLVMLVMAAIFLWISWYMVYMFSPEVYDVRMLAREETERYSTFFDRLDFRLLLKNKWFQSLSATDRQETMRTLVRIVINIFDEGDRHLGYNLIIPVATRELLEVLSKNVYKLRWQKLIYVEVFIREVLNGKTAEDAEKIAHEECVRWLKTQKIRQDFFIKPLWYIGDKIAAFFEKIGEIVVTFQRLYELFNERCPYVTQSGKVKTNLDKPSMDECFDDEY